MRLPLANLIARRRTPKARGIYEKIGGGSPILGQTEAQARALEDALGKEHDWRGYVCMRYWHPMTEAVARSVQRFAPDRIVELVMANPGAVTIVALAVFGYIKGRYTGAAPVRSALQTTLVGGLAAAAAFAIARLIS